MLASMEINKENFLKQLVKLTTDKLRITYVSKCSSESEINQYYSELESMYTFLEFCIDYLYLDNEIDLIKNSYKRVCFLLEKLDRDRTDKDLNYEVNVQSETGNIEFYPVNYLNVVNDKIERLLNLKQYFEQYLDIIEPIKIELSSDKMPDIQKAYFFYFLFNEISKGTDRTQQAKIVSNILGKSLNDKGYNENIYTYIRAPFESDKPKLETRIEHLKEVIKMFEGLNAKNIISDITKQIEKLTKQIEK